MATFQLQLSIRVLNSEDGKVRREMVVVHAEGKDVIDAGRKAVKDFLPELVNAEQIHQQTELEIPDEF